MAGDAGGEVLSAPSWSASKARKVARLATTGSPDLPSRIRDTSGMAGDAAAIYPAASVKMNRNRPAFLIYRTASAKVNRNRLAVPIYRPDSPKPAR